MEDGNLLFYFFIIFFSAKIMGEICVRLKMPAIIGELMAGVLLGNYVLGIIDYSNQVLMSIAEIGVIFLMFHVGLEIRVKDLFAVGRTAVNPVLHLDAIGNQCPALVAGDRDGEDRAFIR